MKQSCPDKKLAELIDEHEGIWLERKGKDPVIFDRFAQRFLRLPKNLDSTSDRNGLEEREKAVRRFFRATTEKSTPQRLKVTIQVLLESLECTTVKRAIESLVRAFRAESKIRVQLHFSGPPSSWCPVLDWAQSLRKNAFLKGNPSRIELHGPFGAVPDEIKEEMFSQGLCLYYVCGWTKDCRREQYTQVQEEFIRELADFGFRVPLVWYVHAENIAEVSRCIETGLHANLSSGFSAPLACQNPYFHGTPCEPYLPTKRGAYAELLADIHRHHRRDDDVLEPLAELVENVSLGGWHTVHRIPLASQFLVSPGDSVKVFRQAPMFANSWITWDAICQEESSSLLTSYVDFCRRQWVRDEKSPCGTCQWRYVCGKVDEAEYEYDAYWLGESVIATVCFYRKLFLRALSWQRISLVETLVSGSSADDANMVVTANP